jgi:predicted HTH domain antitoxin
MNENGGVDECVSLSRAAEILGVCVRTVRREIERRKLIAFHGWSC